jgi:hypothetical protein
MVDGDTGTNANASGFSGNPQTQLCNTNTSSDQGGTISKVELRAYARYAGNVASFDLIPVFGGSTDGSNYDLTASTDGTLGWSDYLDITSDGNAPGSWSWSDVANLDVKAYVNYGSVGPGEIANIGKIEIKVTYS